MKPGIGSGRDPAAHLLVVVHQLEPDLVEVAPGDFVFGRPVEPVGSVRGAARRVEIHQRRQRVLVVPVGVAERTDVAAGGVDRQRRIEDGAELQVFFEIRLPLRASRCVNLVPQPRHLAEAPLLVARVHVDRPGLDDVVLQQRFEVAVEVRDGAEPEARGLDRVHVRDAALLEVRSGAKLVHLGGVEQSRHDLGLFGAKLQSIDSVFRRPLDVGPCLLGRVDRALVPAAARTLVVVDPGRHDLVFRAALLLAH